MASCLEVGHLVYDRHTSLPPFSLVTSSWYTQVMLQGVTRLVWYREYASFLLSVTCWLGRVRLWCKAHKSGQPRVCCEWVCCGCFTWGRSCNACPVGQVRTARLPC